MSNTQIFFFVITSLIFAIWAGSYRFNALLVKNKLKTRWWATALRIFGVSFLILSFDPTIILFAVAFIVYRLVILVKTRDHNDLSKIKKSNKTYEQIEKMVFQDTSEPYKYPKRKRRSNVISVFERAIVVDTETTGFSYNKHDRIVELACVEYINGEPSGKTWQSYFNPHMKIPQAALNIYGKTNKFFHDKPNFHEKVQEFLEFIGETELIAYNAPFDRGFINSELKRLGLPLIRANQFHCALSLARETYPEQPNKLNDVCERLGIDISHRNTHGALVDCHLAGEVFFKIHKL